MSEFDYKAFITYSHADSAVSAWLQRSLESYRIPAKLVGTQTGLGKLPSRIGAIFRDREELTAGSNLGAHLNRALDSSEFLIVVCSPSAHNSRWVNLEIERFLAHHPSSKILCVIAAGEPLVFNDPDLRSQECFPPALGLWDEAEEAGGIKEPLAVDLRPNGDGKRLAKLKLIAGLLGLRLDDLVQRDVQRRQRNLTIAAASSAAGMIAFAYISFLALEARNNEELRRSEAEDLIEFMLSDLRDRLDEVGRLDVLDAVGEKAIEYYSNSPVDEYEESSLGRRARAFHLLGEVEDLEGDLVAAREAFNEAFTSTAELLARNPGDGQRIFEHAQSVFWVAYLNWRLGNMVEAGAGLNSYLELSQQLVLINPDNASWQMEVGHANLNLGVFYTEQTDSESALNYFQLANRLYRDNRAGKDPDPEIDWYVAQSTAYLADANASLDHNDIAVSHRDSEIRIYQEMLASDPANQEANLSLAIAIQAKARLLKEQALLDDAIINFQRAGEIGQQLLQLDSENSFLKGQQAKNFLALAQTFLEKELTTDALLAIEYAEALTTDLMTLNSEVENWIELRQEIETTKAQI